MLDSLLELLLSDDPALFFGALFWVESFCVFLSSGCKQVCLSRHGHKVFPGLLGFSLTILSSLTRSRSHSIWQGTNIWHPAPALWTAALAGAEMGNQAAGSTKDHGPLHPKSTTLTSRPFWLYVWKALYLVLRRITQLVWGAIYRSFKPAGYSRVAPGWMLSDREIWGTKFL